MVLRIVSPPWVLFRIQPHPLPPSSFFCGKVIDESDVLTQSIQPAHKASWSGIYLLTSLSIYIYRKGESPHDLDENSRSSMHILVSGRLVVTRERNYAASIGKSIFSPDVSDNDPIMGAYSRAEVCIKSGLIGPGLGRCLSAWRDTVYWHTARWSVLFIYIHPAWTRSSLGLFIITYGHSRRLVYTKREEKSPS